MSRRRWFHANITGSEAVTLLMEQGNDGSFLARPSHSQPGDFTLSIRQGDRIVHIGIQNTEDYLDFHGGEQFATLVELIDYYYNGAGVLLEKTGNQLYLKYPLSSIDPTSERWYHGQIPGKEAELMLLTSGSNGSYLVRGSRSKPGDFVLSVRSGDEVMHVMIECKNDKYRINANRSFNTLAELVDHYKNHSIKQTTGSVIMLKVPFKATHITASGIGDRISELTKRGTTKEGKKTNKGFIEEFHMLQPQIPIELAKMQEGKRQENTPKNRYKNILPFDYNRVVLTKCDPNMPGSDYINASLIHNLELPEIKRQYIAAQGCIQATVADFWRMIWQQNCRIIVMATQLVEQSRSKCVKYWPTLDTSQEERMYDGTLTITNTSERNAQYHDMRELRIVFNSNNPNVPPEKPRKVYHFQYKRWSDHGVPSDPGCVLGFLEDISGIHQSILDAGPLVFHCSAGIGRTGTMIIIDMMLQQMKLQGLDCDIDVQKMTVMVRGQRSGMVQTVAQYKFIYMAVKHYIDATLQRMHAKQRGNQGNKADVYENIELSEADPCPPIPARNF